MIENILEFLKVPLLITFNIMAAWTVADIIQGYLNQKKYTSALIAIIVTAILAWPAAICIAIYVGFRMTQKRKKEEYKENYNNNSEPGSTADYERWKAEREKREE